MILTDLEFKAEDGVPVTDAESGETRHMFTVEKANRILREKLEKAAAAKLDAALRKTTQLPQDWFGPEEIKK